MEVQLTASTTGPRSARELTIYIDSPTRFDMEVAARDADVLAHKRGFDSRDVVVIQTARLDGHGYGMRRTYATRWRGRSFSVAQ